VSWRLGAGCNRPLPFSALGLLKIQQPVFASDRVVAACKKTGAA
jgi:hypothetical protein